MFLTFLMKEDFHILDLSVFINCSPERIMFYYYDSYIKIPLDTYLQMKEWAQSDDTVKSCLNKWLELLEETLEAREGLNNLLENEYLNATGPYYYTPTNTKIHFSKLNQMNNEPLTSADFAVLFNLHKSPAIDKTLQKYYKTRKNLKKVTRSKEEILNDLSMCQEALKQISKINRHIDYQNLLLQHRQALLAKIDLMPEPPETMPVKPEKPEEPQLSFSSMLALNISKKRQAEYARSCSDYNRRMKIYLIRYREHEKACERYKNALQNCEEQLDYLITRCVQDSEDTQSKLDAAQAMLDMYQFILEKSYIHSNYHTVDSISTFINYLETGRAEDLQDCMNLYEEERHWREIKASQDRIETTIHFLQAEGEAAALSSSVGKMIASASEKFT